MIAFDIDNVLFDFDKLLRRFVKKEYGVRYPKEDYKAPLPGRTKVGFSAIIDGLILRMSDDLEPLPFTTDYLARFYRFFKKPIRLVTSRNPYTKEVTKVTLKKWFPNIKFELFFEGNQSKKDFLSGCKFFIDDQPKNITPSLKNLKAGLLFTRPWNVSFTVKNNLYRVENLREAWRICVRLSK